MDFVRIYKQEDKKMFSFKLNEKALKSFFCDGKGVVISKKEVEELLNNELSKPENEIDVELVNSCVDLMLNMQGIEAPQTPKVAQTKTSTIKKVKLNKFFKTAIAASLAVVIITVANSVSTNAFNFNISKQIAKWYNNVYTLFVGCDENVDEKGDEDLWNYIKNHLEQNNFSVIHLPQDNEFNFNLSSDYGCEEAPVSKVISFLLENSKKDKLMINVTEFNSLDYAKIMFKSDISNGTQIQINGKTYYYFTANKEKRIVFLEGSTRYYYTSQTLTKDELIKIIENIK